MKLLRRWWLWVIVILVMGVIGYSVLRPDAPVEYVTEIVERTDLVQTVDANGEVVSLDEVDLSFDLSGTVATILVQVGDSVGIGDLLAVLETQELVADLQSAYQAVQISQGTLDAQKAGASIETIAVSEASLSSADIDYENKIVLNGFVESLYLAQEEVQAAALATASDNVNQTIADNSELLTQVYDDLLGSAWAGAIEARSAYSKGDEIMGIHNSTLNDDYQNLLSAGNSSAVNLAKTAFSALDESLVLAEQAIVVAEYGSSTSIATAAQEVESALGHAAQMLLYLRTAITAMPVTGDLSIAEATALASSVDTARVSVQVDQVTLQNAFQSVQDALNTSTSNLEDANNALTGAQASYNSAVATRLYQVVLAEQAVQSSQAIQSLREAELAQAKAVPRTVDLASYEADVSRSQAAYVSAQARLAKAEIHSPIIGDVTQITIKAGEQVVASNAVITVQTTQEQFEIVADVSESDISKLELGDATVITFDAFSSSDILLGTVRKIEPAEKLVEGVVYYEVTVSLLLPVEGFDLRPGLSADLIFTTDSKDQILTVSQRALYEREGVTYVRVLENSISVEREVTTGLRGDLGRMEILSGLAVGEEVIIREIN
ncbi:HlyD family efflux transporter periplasmic adaptor subunit [Candidatus Uhrbacteria bacterium]|nr:HlyD family efflux transporter periplasmic adaptor subunit [Candidatus Uhrbacteria bacterium]